MLKNSPIGKGAQVSWDEEADRYYDQKGDAREETVISDSFLVR
jgi:hypothetical protein